MSPITSNVTKATLATRDGIDGPESHDETTDSAVAQFEGMLFANVLKPLSQELGVLGDVLTDSIATTVARGQHDQFYEHLRTLAAAAGSRDDGSP